MKVVSPKQNKKAQLFIVSRPNHHRLDIEERNLLGCCEICPTRGKNTDKHVSQLKDNMTIFSNSTKDKLTKLGIMMTRECKSHINGYEKT